MTDNRTAEPTTTEHLRALLDERGIEWKSGRTNENNTSWDVGDLRVTAKELSDGTLLIQQYSRKHFTPEQAIAATLGYELNPDGLPAGLTISDNGSLLNWRGENYVKQCTLGEQPAKSGADALSRRARDMARNIQGNLGRCLYRRKDVAEMEEVSETLMELADELNAKLGSEINGETSDGYHTFNELYHHRAVLFSVIVRDHRELAWKARKHHDGTMYEGMFIVGIETPKGQATYHYDLDPYWDMFDCEEREFAPEWDGHTPDEAIARIAELGGDDGYEAKMDALLCRLTNGKWSKSRAYDLDFMESCVNEEFEALYSEEQFSAPVHGTLTAEQVLEAVEKHWHDLPDEYDMPEATALPEYSYNWQAIADELNAELGSGTCEMYEDIGATQTLLTCSECGYTTRDYSPIFCGGCGARIRKAVKR